MGRVLAGAEGLRLSLKAACRIAEHLATLSLKPIQKTLVLRIPCYFCCEPGGSARQRDPVWTVPMRQAVL